MRTVAQALAHADRLCTYPTTGFSDSDSDVVVLAAEVARLQQVERELRAQIAELLPRGSC